MMCLHIILCYIKIFTLVKNGGSCCGKEENRCIVAGIYDYQYKDNKEHYKKLCQFVDDIKETIKDSKSWVVVLSPFSSPTDDKKQQKIRIGIHVPEVREDNTLKDCTNVEEGVMLQAFYDELKEKMQELHNIETTIQYQTYKPTHIVNYVHNKLIDGVHPNVITISLAHDYRVFGQDVKEGRNSIKTLAEVLHKHFDKDNMSVNLEDWKASDCKKHRLAQIPNHKGDDA